MWSDSLKEREATRTKEAILILKNHRWTEPLLKRFKDGGEFIQSNKSIMFELRFAAEICERGFEAVYESLGINDSSIEFKIEVEGDTWLIELVSIQSSDAAREAVVSNAGFYSQLLQTGNSDERQTPEGELILVEQKIGEKVFHNRKPHKFPEPKPNVYHVIIVDMRGFLDGGGGDKTDYTQIAIGADTIPDELTAFWKNKDGGLEPIKGLYEGNNPLNAAKYVRERIHYIGFLAEKKYSKDEFKSDIYHISNPVLFRDCSAIKIYDRYPMKSIEQCITWS
ncbi:MAG: hypothetical protein K8R67_11535 [Desulfobacteraceae bacterium]|nr:hypothetical protein [Desulfobacteraceae bacterium]